jgi:hypothetical protein
MRLLFIVTSAYAGLPGSSRHCYQIFANEIDMSFTAAVATLASTDLIAKLLEPLANKIGTGVVDKSKEHWRRYTSSFRRYLNEAEGRHKYFSSQIFANDGQLLENYYIPLTLQKVGPSTDKPAVRVDDYPSDLIGAYKDVLIVDTAGMGKSTLLKFIFLRSISAGEAIPIFVELRKLSKEKNLLGFVIEELKIAPDSTGFKLLENSIATGIFTFFLDGFDEIPDDEKQAVSDQILKLKALGDGNRFILSSREEQSLSYLAEFRKFNIKPLEKDEAFSLIRKIMPSAKVADSLIAKITEQSKNGLDEFLKNPLLVSLLVKSYMHSPVLPVRLSEFYRQVFDALFQTHDAKKELGGFARKKKSQLDLDRFHKILRALGALTYQENKLEFTTDALLVQIEDAKSLTSESGFAASNFQHDLLHAVPLFVRDGGISRWAHRSLQEYFAAAYICVDAKEEQRELLVQLYESGIQRNANILRLCADIDGKTFKHVLVQRYLDKQLAKAMRDFQVEEFPGIDASLLSERKSIIFDHFQYLSILPRPLDQELAHGRISSFISGIPDAVGVAFLNEKGQSLRKDDKVKFLISLRRGQSSVVNSIIHTYFDEQILNFPDEAPISHDFVNVPFETPIEINSSPNNPLNSPENFAVTLQILNNYWILEPNSIHYDLGRMLDLQERIAVGRQASSRLGIRFN